MIVDSHQHFWDPARGDYDWLTPGMPICRFYGPQDMRPLLDRAGVDATILVQAAPTAAETDYLLEIARRTSWVLGVVGWIDLETPDAMEQIARRARDPHFVGLRPMLHDLPDPDWILSPHLQEPLAAIAAHGLVFDALIRPPHIAAITQIARRHPNLSVVVDHGAKPRIGDAAATAAWRAAMAPLAVLPNVACKISGLMTEMIPGASEGDVDAVIRTLLDLFGPERLLWGSDWPVLTLAGDYEGWCNLARRAIQHRVPSALNAVMGGNALRLYDCEPVRRRQR